MLVSRRPVPARASVAVLIATGGLAGLAGCGDGKDAKQAPGPEAQVRTVVRQFGAASAKKDYQTICDRLIAKSLSDNVEELGLPCELAFKQGLGAVKGATLRVRTVRVQGTKAFAAVHTTAVGQAASDDTLELVKTGGTWRISSLSAPAARAAPPAAGAVKLW
jgi:hypothetical protein